MDSERIARARQIIEHARELNSIERAAYLDEACSGDPELQNEVELQLLEKYETIGAPAGATRPLKTDSIGRYRLLRRIGEGGMGVVYLAELSDAQVRQPVALKVVKYGIDSEEILRRFERERQILARLEHPNIARFLDAGSTAEGLPFFVMEYVQGTPIDRYCDDLHLAPADRLNLFCVVCSAVQHAHQNLVVHRDLKPGNILVTSDGVPKLLDFGIAKILTADLNERSDFTATAFRVMTPDYASPEQIRGDAITTATDVYSLGVLLYQLLTGHLPYQITGKSATDMIRIVSEEEPEKPSARMMRTDGFTSLETISSRRGSTPQKLQKIIQGDLDQIVLKAMRKEVQRRYASVEQFSEDVRRYLQNLPIRARKDTIIYRTAKFVRRNQWTVAVSGFAFLAILISTVIASIAQWRADQQAKSFQEFGQEVSRIESVMRYAYLLPLHNIQQDKKQVMDRLENIRARMRTLGKLATGPGYYSLGRGYLSLHRYQDAHDHLIQAWQKHRYQEPAVANALGLSLAMLYRDKLQEAERLYSKDSIEQRKKDLEKQYRDPALQHIHGGKTASSTSEPVEYIDAILAFLGKRYPEALQKADSAAQKISWLYEARVLQGDVLAAMGADQYADGKTELARNYFDQAKSKYLEAANKGQSDPDVYNSLCALQSIVQRSFMDRNGTAPDSVIREGIGYCEKALRSDSENFHANVLVSDIYGRLAYDQSVNGKDCAGSVQKSVDFANAARKIDSENGLVYRAIGNAYRTLAWAEIQKQGDAIRFLDLTDSNLEKASVKMPYDYDLLSMRGNNLVDRARYEVYGGKNPGPTLEKAITVLRKAMELNPKYFKSYTNLGTAYYTKGSYEADTGSDPGASLQQSISLFRKSLELNPNYPNAYQYTAVAFLSIAEFLRDQDSDPIPSLDQSIAAYEKSLVLAPDDAFGFVGLGIGFLRKGDRLYKTGKAAEKELAAARDAFRKSLNSNDQIVLTYVYFAETEMLAARYAIAAKQSPNAFFEEAGQRLRTALTISPDCGECLEGLAALHLLRAEHLQTIQQSFETELQAGIVAADQALKQNAQLANAYAIRGKLLLLRAQTSSGKDRQKSAADAVSSLDQAFKIKKSLERGYGAARQEAKQLASVS